MVIRRRENLEDVAKKMFEATEKEAYYLGDLMIRNLSELIENLEKFTENEAEWVASWIEYLGDAECAKNIRANPSRFKDTLKNRYRELRRYR